MRTALLLALAGLAFAADPTFLRRHIAGAEPQPDPLSTGVPGVHYRPAFGAGDAGARHCKGIARYGELTLAPGSATQTVQRPNEEQIFVVLNGAGAIVYNGTSSPLRKYDFLYVPPGVAHSLANETQTPLRLLLMGFRIPAGASLTPVPTLPLANILDVPMTPLPGHGPTTQFRLLLGDTNSKRDRLAVAHTVTSLFLMDFAPGGTNIPHHHETEEEIYYVLQGSGEMVAGGGADGNEGRYPSRQGDAWFIRLNATVGFYSGAQPGDPHDMVLAVRSRFPFPKPR
jgi:mannose-6-phosphate isomerase-like protein (cupin superfamily)